MKNLYFGSWKFGLAEPAEVEPLFTLPSIVREAGAPKILGPCLGPVGAPDFA